MTSKAIIYYSKTGKTEAVINKDRFNTFDIIKLNDIDPYNLELDSYQTIIIGTPTYGRGVPPMIFKNTLPKWYKLKGKNIGLFGSGNTIYGDEYCGALDVLEQILETKNKILFKYKFEGYPRDNDIETLTKLILEA